MYNWYCKKMFFNTLTHCAYTLGNSVLRYCLTKEKTYDLVMIFNNFIGFYVPPVKSTYADGCLQTLVCPALWQFKRHQYMGHFQCEDFSPTLKGRINVSNRQEHNTNDKHINHPIHHKDHYDKQVVLIVPGYAGCHTSHYVEQFMSSLNNVNMFVLDRREVRPYGDYSDIKEALSLLQSYGYANFIIVGYSAGCISLIKFAASENVSDIDVMCIAIQGPYDLVQVSYGLPPEQVVPSEWSKVLSCYNGKRCLYVQEYDFALADKNNQTHIEFYKENSCDKDLLNVKCPLITLNSEDDPLIHSAQIQHVINASKKNQNVMAVVTKIGGHLGYDNGIWLHGMFLPALIGQLLIWKNWLQCDSLVNLHQLSM